MDLFLLAQSYMDIATLATLPSTTGGSVYHYMPFNPQLDCDQLLNDLKCVTGRLCTRLQRQHAVPLF